MRHERCPIFCILPPHILRHIATEGDAKQQGWAWGTLIASEQMRGERQATASIMPARTVIASNKKQRTIYDAGRGSLLPGKLVRTEGSPRSKDASVNEAYDGAGATYDMYQKVFKRNSIDDRGMALNSTVHFRRNYDNAFWNGQQMVYGDGDGQLFNRFTKCVDVIAHELTHGVTQFEAGLVYQDQPGALNESMSDVFGSLVKQYRRKQTVKEADWLIGQGLLMKSVKGVALRSMAAPGTAYDDPVLGKDPQPAHMRDYVKTSDDNGGVHINSGIPNHAFHAAAMRIGGYAWEKAGQIWYVMLRDKMRPMSTFQDCARMTYSVAAELFGKGSLEQKAVKDGWAVVGIRVK